MAKQYILVDVDTQIDFMKESGALYAPAAQEVLDNITKLTTLDLPRIGSVDSHAFDAWEFQENGGPFPAHCVKGSFGWMKPPEASPERLRFVSMGSELEVGEAIQGEGNRAYTYEMCAKEVMSGVSIYFEKEVYSLFANPFAEGAVQALVANIRAAGNEPVFAVYGYCTGGFCVDAAVLGLAKMGYEVELLLDATAALDVKGGIEKNTLPDMERAGVTLRATKDIVG